MAAPEKINQWLLTLDLAQLSREHAGRRLISSLRHSMVYLEPPTVERRGVRGRLRDEKGVVFETTITPTGAHIFGGTGLSECTCGEGMYRGCPHADALTVDLALSPRLRTALLNRAIEPAHLDELPELREAALRDQMSLQVLRSWLPSAVRSGKNADPELQGALEYGLAFFDTSDPYSSRYWDHLAQVPLLEVRPRHPGVRSVIEDSDRTAQQFTPPDTKVLRAITSIHGRKGFFSEGAAASLTLELLRGLPVYVEGSRKAVQYAEEPVLVRLVPCRLPRYRVGHRPTRVEHPHLKGMAEPVPEDEADDEAAEMGRLARPTNAFEEQVVPALEARFYTRSGSLDVPSAEAILFAGQFPYLWVPAQNQVFRLHPSVDVAAAFRLFLVPSVELVDGYGPRLLRALRQGLQPSHVGMPPAADLGLLPAERPRLWVRLEGEPLEVTVQLEAEYSFGSFTLGNGLASEALGSTRDLEVESAALDRLRATRLTYNNAEGRFHAEGTAAAQFWLEDLPKLRAPGDPELELVVPERLARTSRVRHPRIRFRVTVEGGLLDLTAQAIADDLELPLQTLRRAVSFGQRWIVLEDGALAEITDELQDLVADTTELLGNTSKAQLTMHHLGRVEKWLENSAAQVDLDQQATTLRERLRELAVATEPRLPGQLQAELRPYQLQGVAWLQLLSTLGVGGVLADDMGLGKTLMTLTLLAEAREAATRGALEAPSGPALIVCPTSVAANWLRESARFTPGLRTALFHGAGREAAVLAQADLIVTTYAILRRDCATLAAVNYSFLVFDEAQNLKNASTAAAKAARLVPARLKLALSGTPVENHLAELWALVDLVAPGLLSARASFARRFEGPITGDPHGPASRRLRALIRPFVLRRTKRQVLSELPPKEEIVQTIALGPEQRRLYDALVGVIQEEVSGGNSLAVLKGLLRLRQMACDPRLVDRSLISAPSAKREAFLELVRELVRAGRRTLVFSQYVELLSLWRRDLDREGIAYEYLDGSTRAREAVVDRFQHGDAPLFLISLKAGGSGLNLTAADTVILCDPWWNPAVESQAADRAHRMGQTRPVTVVRLVAAGTVEERIQELGLRKRELAESVVGDDAGALTGLTSEDLKNLLGTATLPSIDVDEEAFVDAVPSLQSNSPEPSSSLLDAASPETLEALRRDLQAWVEATGNNQRKAAQITGISSHLVSLLLRGKLARLPQQEAERARAILAAALGDKAETTPGPRSAKARKTPRKR